MDSFSDAGASHTAKSQMQNLFITFCKIKTRPILLNTDSNSGRGPLFVLEIRWQTDQLNIK